MSQKRAIKYITATAIILAVVFYLNTNYVMAICGDGFCEANETQDSCLADCDQYKVSSIVKIKENGGRVDWSHSGNNLVVFDKKGADGYYDVYTMKPDGSNEICLTCSKADLPQMHNGNPAWHSSGNWIIFQSVNPVLIADSLTIDEVKIKTAPGAGWANDLWLMDSSGQNFYKLTQVNAQGGVLHPHFSSDGQKITWAQRLGPSSEPFGEWAIKVADFNIVQNVPVISNTLTYQPGTNPRFYETHGFSADGTKIYFSGNPENQNSYGFDIYIFDLISQKLTNLTNTPNEWDEHASLSVDGSHLVWMSTKNIEQTKLPIADYWVMKTDGSNQRRITYFNKIGSAHYINVVDGVVAADSSWSPDGKKLMTYVIENRETRTGSNYMIEFENNICILGDIDCNKIINSQDIQIVINVFFGTNTNVDQRQRADLNTDNQVNILDIQKVINIVLGV